MPPISLDGYLDSATVIAALMAVISALRFRSRGAAAYVMAVAFLVLSGTFRLIRVQAPMPWIILAGVLLIVLLGTDVAIRAGRSTKPGGGR